jgi:hypothetical protein
MRINLCPRGEYLMDQSAKRRTYSSMFLILMLLGCGGGSSQNNSTLPLNASTTFSTIVLSGVPIDQGNFDPAPTQDNVGDIWMSYSHVSIAATGIAQVETRLATTNDAGLNWQDVGVKVNAATTLPLPVPLDVNTVTHEVSRLVYDPYAVAAGTNPWIMLWHRYLAVLNGTQTLRLFQHGWIAMKSGPTAMSLTGERKLFTGAFYDSVNDADTFGPPEYPLDSLYPTALGGCDVITEPGILVKSNGIYVSLSCVGLTSPGKIILLRCAHDMNSCDYLGDFLQNSEASYLQADFDAFSASELVSVKGQDYLIVTPAILDSDLYRGCVAYKITDLDSALVERNVDGPVPSLVIEPHGDFNGACGYIPALTGSGIIISEAFIGQTPIFRIFSTDKRL